MSPLGPTLYSHIEYSPRILIQLPINCHFPSIRPSTTLLRVCPTAHLTPFCRSKTIADGLIIVEFIQVSVAITCRCSQRNTPLEQQKQCRDNSSSSTAIPIQTWLSHDDDDDDDDDGWPNATGKMSRYISQGREGQEEESLLCSPTRSIARTSDGMTRNGRNVRGLRILPQPLVLVGTEFV